MKSKIITLKADGYDNFMYIIANGGEAVVVDPAWNAELVKTVLAQEYLTLTAILLTHAHDDHTNAVSDLYSDDVSLFLSADEYPLWANCPVDAVLLQDGDEIFCGADVIQMIATPGHTAGSCCFYVDNNLITGDTLFVYGCGRTDFPSGDSRALFESLQKLKKLPPHTQILSGHDYGIEKNSTLSEQITYNPFMTICSLDDFVRFREELAKKIIKIPYRPMEYSEIYCALTQPLLP